MNRRLAERALLLAVLAAVGLIAIYPLSDFDTFWHLANGRYMVETRQVVEHEVFSYTVPGAPFNNHAWAAQILLYLVYAAGAEHALIAFKAACFVGVSALLLAAARRRGADLTVSLAVIALTAYACVWRMLERPEIFSFLALAFLGWLLARIDAEPGAARKTWLIVPLVLAWDTLHGSLFGLICLAVWGAGKTLEGMLSTGSNGLLKDPRYRSLLGVGVAVVILEALFPFGLLRSGFFFGLVAGGSLAEQIGEFTRTPIIAGFAPFWAMAAIGVPCALNALRRREFVAAILIALFLYFAVSHTRMTAIYAVVAAPIIAAEASRALRAAALRLPGVNVGFAVLSLSVFAGFTVWYKFFGDEHTNRYGWGLNGKLFPAASLRFADDNRLPGQRFNLGHQGGYLAYFSAQPIFLYNHHQTFGRIVDSLGDPALADRWGIQHAFVGDTYNDYRHLFPISRWAAVYWEPSSLLMLRRTEANRALIERYEILLVTPQRTADELRRFAGDAAALSRMVRELADYLTWRRDADRAALFAEFVVRPGQPLPIEARRELISAALRANQLDPSLLSAARQLGI